jgi:FMN phosphatase YigB (HAD superfamily)
MKIIFDYNRTLYNPETNSLYFGVIKLLQDLSKNHELFLISKNEPGREDGLEKQGIKKYFKKISFVDEKTTDLFKELVQGDKNSFVIGDRVREEIFVGNQLGFITIWVQQGKFAVELPENLNQEPNYIVKSIDEIKNIISKYEK